MRAAIYNENEPFAAEWLESLITHGLIAQGHVDRRSIADLAPADIAGHGQRHFFAGIGGWSHALRLAGVADDAPVWTGSCPCQPFSDAGQGRGTGDPRHLWPAWFALIEQCRPPIIFGEQVASSSGLEWLDAVSADLERCGYAFGAADLCAAGVGAPHIRQRLYFVAYADGEPGRLLLRSWRSRQADAQAVRGGEADRVADAAGERRIGRTGVVPPRPQQPDAAGRGEGGGVADATTRRRPTRRAADGGDGTRSIDDGAPRGGALADTDGQQRERSRRTRRGQREPADGGSPGALADTAGQRGGGKRESHRRQAVEPPRHGAPDLVADTDGAGLEVLSQQQAWRQRATAQRGSETGVLGDAGRTRSGRDRPAIPRPQGQGQGQGQGYRFVGDFPGHAGATRGFWSPADWLLCRDPKGGAPVARPVEPGTFPLVTGVPDRVGLLSGYGNSIVPQTGAAFIVAALEALAQEFA